MRYNITISNVYDIYIKKFGLKIKWTQPEKSMPEYLFLIASSLKSALNSLGLSMLCLASTFSLLNVLPKFSFKAKLVLFISHKYNTYTFIVYDLLKLMRG